MRPETWSTSFDVLEQEGLSGVSLSARTVRPVVRFSLFADQIVPTLIGRRTFGQQISDVPAISLAHDWVLDGKTVRPLPKGTSDAIAELGIPLDGGALQFAEVVRLSRSVGTDIELEFDEALFAPAAVRAEDLPSELNVVGLKANLFPYQAKGVQWMHQTLRRTGGVILADEMGLGKTIQIISLLLLSPPTEENPALIICPTSLIANWRSEILKFAPDLSVLLHRGTNRAGVPSSLRRAQIVISTYDTLVGDITLFTAFEWSWFICDEAQALKNPETRRRKAAARVSSRYTVPMTGTPVENSLKDLWSLADLAIPGILGTSSSFDSAFEDSLESANQLARLTDPILLKRRVAEVAKDLPERIDIDVPIELNPAHAAHYQRVREETIAKYPIAGDLVATLQLQLFCAHPWLRKIERLSGGEDDFELVSDKTLPLLTPKIERTIEILEEAFLNDRKVLIFALFNQVGELIREAAKELPTAYWGAINGSTPEERRQSIVDEFSAHQGPGVLVLNPKAAGAGLNITAATIVVHYTQVWNPATEAQASGRAHRRGQTEPVQIYRLFYEDTVERVMIDRSLWKRELSNEAVPVSSRDKTDLARALTIAPGQ